MRKIIYWRFHTCADLDFRNSSAFDYQIVFRKMIAKVVATTTITVKSCATNVCIINGNLQIKSHFSQQPFSPFPRPHKAKLTTHLDDTIKNFRGCVALRFTKIDRIIIKEMRWLKLTLARKKLKILKKFKEHLFQMQN